MAEQLTEKDREMRRRVETMLYDDLRREDQAARIIGMLRAEFVACSWAEQSLTLAFPMQDWELNLMGTMMGGVTCAAMDTACGILIYAISGENPPPTVSLNINYVKPVMPRDRLIIKAKISNFGRRVVHLTAEGSSERTGVTVATASAVFLSTYMMKE